MVGQSTKRHVMRAFLVAHMTVTASCADTSAPTPPKLSKTNKKELTAIRSTAPGTPENTPVPEKNIETIISAGKVSGNAITSGTIGGSTAILTTGNLMTSGNVGIGTTAATSILEVNGVISQRPAAMPNTHNYLLTNASNNAATNHLNPGILLHGSVNYFGLDLGYSAASQRYRTRLFAPTGHDIALSSHVSNSAPTAQASFKDLVVVNGESGFMGIGSASPVATLDVQGSGGVVLNAGNVGIGTTAPAAALHVAGDIAMKQGYAVATNGTGARILSGTVSVDFVNHSSRSGTFDWPVAFTTVPVVTVSECGSSGAFILFKADSVTTVGMTWSAVSVPTASINYSAKLCWIAIGI